MMLVMRRSSSSRDVIPPAARYTRTDIALVPLRFESGTRFKILEAGACGAPVVSTTLGAEGLAVTHESHLLIADEPKAFGESVVRLILDRKFADQMAQNLKKLVGEKYSVASLTVEACSILNYLKCGDSCSTRERHAEN